MKWGLWSTTAASNSATPPDGWPEGQAPSTVNDCAREMMAQIRTAINDIQFIDLGVTPTETTNTTFTLAGNQMQWYTYGTRVKANVGGTLFYGTVISSSYTTNTGVTLRFDNGGAPLTNSLSAVSTGFPGALNNSLPEHVYRSLPVNINGQFDIWQDPVTTAKISGSAAGVYVTDMWAMALNASAGVAIKATRFERSANASNVPTLAQCGVLLDSSIGISCSTGETVVANSDYARLSTPIEGYDFRQIAGKPVTVQFWVNSNHTGTYCLALGDGTHQSYIAQFSVSSVSTWEKKTFNIPKFPLSGTWNYSTGAALLASICLAAGSSYQTTGGQWTSVAALATSAQTNFLGAAGNTIKIAAFDIREGNNVLPLAYRPYQDELLKCQRYFQVIGGIPCFGFAINTVNALFTLPLNPEMMLPPTLLWPSLGNINFTKGDGSVVSSTAAPVSLTITNRFAEIETVAVGSPLTAGQGSCLVISAGALLRINARL